MNKGWRVEEKTWRKRWVKNRVALEEEEGGIEYDRVPRLCQAWASNDLRRRGLLISGGGARSIWLPHGVETFKKRWHLGGEKRAQEGIVYTEPALPRFQASPLQSHD